MDYEQQIRAAFQSYLGRDPNQSELDYYSGQMERNPNFNLEGQISATYNPANLRDVAENLPMRMPEGEGVVPLAYTLATGTELRLPEYQTAGFTADQLAAFEAGRGLQGAYEPFLEEGYASTLQGIGSMGQALSGTREFAGQIPGAVGPGQDALSQAAMDLQSSALSGSASAEEAAEAIRQAAASSDPDTRRAAEELMGSSARLGGLFQSTSAGLGGVAQQASLGGREVEGRLAEQLGRAQQAVSGVAGSGIEGLVAASGQIGAAARQGIGGLTEAGAGAQQVAEQTRAGARRVGETLGEGLSEATGGAREAAATGISGADVASERARASTAQSQKSLMGAADLGISSARKGISALRGTGRMYSPDMIAPYMNTYEDAAVQQALADIARQGEIMGQDVRARAVQAGAFGGSRQAVAEQELGRNLLEQMGRTSTQMRAQGFESAAARSQEAFESAKRRQQNLAALKSQIGQAGAGTAISAAQQSGSLGLAAEQLAQTGSLQGARIGLSSEQLASANEQAMAQTGMNIEQLSAQTGLSAQELAGQLAGQAGAMGMSAGQSQADIVQSAAALGMTPAQFEAANAQALASTGMGVEELTAQTGMNAQQIIGQLGLSTEGARQGAATGAAGLSQSQAQLGMAGAGQAGALGLEGAGIEMSGASQAGNLGLQGAQLGLSGIQAGLGAQQQAAGIGQGIAGLGQQQLGFGQAAQGLGQQDVSMMGQLGQQQQAQAQAELDAQRMNEYQQALMPYQQLAFASDIAVGAPTGITSIMSQPGPNPVSQAIGLGIAGLNMMGSGGPLASLNPFQ